MKNVYKILKSLKFQISLLIFLFFCSNAWCQETSVNLYTNWSYFPQDVTTHIDLGDSKVGYSGLSFSYKKMNRNFRFHEFELKTGLRFPSNTEASSSRVYNHFRYELGKQKPLGSSGKFAFEYEGGLRLFHFYRMVDPKVIDSYRNTLNIISIGTAFLTGINYNLNDNLYVQLKAILFDLSFGINFHKTNRPDIHEALRTNSYMDINLAFAKGLRLGVGYKIGKR